MLCRYGFIYSEFHEGAHYSELLELQRKLLLTGVALLIPGSVARLGYAFIVTLLFFFIHDSGDFTTLNCT